VDAPSYFNCEERDVVSKQQRYTQGFKAEAVKRVLEQGIQQLLQAGQLSLQNQ